MNQTRVLWRRAAAAGVTATALVAMTACGSSKAASGGSGGGSGSDDLSKGDKVSQSQISDILTKAVNGLDTAHMTLSTKGTSGSTSMNITGEGDVQAKPLAEHMTMKISGAMSVNAEIVMLDKTMYMKGLLGDSWVKLTADQLAQAGGGSSLSSMTNPLQMVETLSKSVKTATYEGQEKVGGDDADHYKITVDSAALTGALGGAGAAAGSLPASLDEDIWVDGDGHLRKTSVDMGKSGTMDVEMSNYGEKVNIQAPPAAQVKEMPGVGG